jgi:hypothetical protein
MTRRLGKSFRVEFVRRTTTHFRRAVPSYLRFGFRRGFSVYCKRYRLQLAFALVALFAEESFAAGNVSVISKKGRFLVRGDDEANCLAIGQNFLEDGGFTIAFDGCGTTTINASSEPLVFSFDGAPPGFDIDMKGGDDTLDLQESLTPAWLHIRMGSGNDVLVGLDVTIAGDSKIGMGRGDDIMAVEFFIFGGDLQVTTGPGDDLVRTRFTTVAGQLVLRGGPGNDTLMGDIGAGSTFIRGFEAQGPVI